MKSYFFEHMPIPDDLEKDIWENGIFCYDANILSLVYKLSKDSRTDLIKMIDLKKDRTIIPYHAAKEFILNTENNIKSQSSIYSSLNEIIAKFEKDCKNTCEKITEHHCFDTDDYLLEIEEAVKKCTEYLQQQENIHNDLYNPKDIQDQITSILDNCISKPFSDAELGKILQEGAERYAKKIPPGYEDKNKNNGNEFGDLIVWKHLIEISIAENKPIIFISNDQKKDWYHIDNGKKKGPRHELRREFYDKTGNHIIITNLHTCFSLSQKYDNKDDIFRNKIRLIDEVDNLLKTDFNNYVISIGNIDSIPIVDYVEPSTDEHSAKDSMRDSEFKYQAYARKKRITLNETSQNKQIEETPEQGDLFKYLDLMQENVRSNSNNDEYPLIIHDDENNRFLFYFNKKDNDE